MLANETTTSIPSPSDKVRAKRKGDGHFSQAPKLTNVRATTWRKLRARITRTLYTASPTSRRSVVGEAIATRPDADAMD
jgi:hypothetical protein